MGLEIAVEEQAEQLAHRLQHATDVLLEKLFAYLSQLPEEEEEEEEDDDDDDDDDEEDKDEQNTTSSRQRAAAAGGMTLPASAIGWLSSQYYPPEIHENEVCPTVWSPVPLKDRLRLLRFLLPRVTHLRITRQVWPPELPKQQRKRTSRRRQQQHRNQPGTEVPTTPRGQRPPEELNCSVVSVSSALTVEEAPSASNPSSGAPTPQAFWNYMQVLQNHPTLDMRVFPRVQALVLESIPPTWISHFSRLRPSLQVLRWNRACLYDYLPRLFRTVPPIQAKEDAAATPSDKGETPAPIMQTSSVTKQIYPHLTHLNLNRCGIGERSGLRQTLSRCAPHLECVSLMHNDLVSQKAALQGLGHATRLTKLNLSYNSLTRLPQAHLYLGGQLQHLQLSYNQLETVTGLDRLYALEELWLDHNCLADLSELAGLCQLPQLKLLQLQGNPGLEQESPQYIKQIWTWFLQYRSATTPQELPVCNGRNITREQWNILMRELVPVATTPVGGTLSLPARYRRVQRKDNQKRRTARISGLLHGPKVVSSTAKTTASAKVRRKRPVVSSKTKVAPAADPSSRGSRLVSFSVQDVLVSLQTVQVQEETNGNQEETNDMTSNAPNHTKESAPSPHYVARVNQIWSEPFRMDDIVDDTLSGFQEDIPSFPLGDQQFHFDEDDVEDTAEMTTSTSTREEVNAAVVHDGTSIVKPTDASEETTSIAGKTPKQSNGGKNKVFTIKLRTGANKIFDVMTADWDDLVDKVAGGLIPDGKPRMPIHDLTPASNRKDGAFPSEAADLLSPESSVAPLLMPQPASSSVESVSEEGMGDQSAISSMVFRSNPLPDQIYPDDFSVPSSLGTNRDDFPSRASKFQVAEENAAYDGPETWKDRNVLDNFKLYFETYVFPSQSTVTPDEDEVEDEEFDDGWQTVALRYPRIQLWPEDRRWLETPSPSNIASPTPTAARSAGEWALATRERFVRVWEEDVIPCGKPALRRLAPNRRIRLGFHGDQLYIEGAPDPYAECRKVYLCLSSAAFYIILRTDDVTKKQDEKGIKKRFPNPIPESSRFEDAPWPHAVARHTFQELQTITIGFEFQRLILQFSNPTIRKNDPFVYVLLTCNKKETVSLLQEIQRLAKDAKPETIDLNSDAAPVTIENDSQLVLDAVQAAVTPEVVGTIIHYQIVQQRWKHGEVRGTVRRVCVVTDTKLFLMDEDYHADAHKPLDPPATGVAAIRKKHRVDLANVTYRKVDEADLKQVTEVQAAGADPKAITIVISPLSRLSRTHRWRLISRDNVGAERLVDDVRKAMALVEE